jgi:hypothetical protein
MFKKLGIGIFAVMLVVGVVLIILSVQAGSLSDLAQSDIEARAVKHAEDNFNVGGTAQVVSSKKTTLAEAEVRFNPSQTFSSEDPTTVVWIVVLKGKVTFYGPPALDANGKMASSPFTYNHAYELIDRQGRVIEWGGLSDNHIPDLNGPIVSVYPTLSGPTQTKGPLHK